MKDKISIDEKQFSASDCFKKSLNIFEELKMEANYAQVLDNFASHKLSVGETEKARELSTKEKEVSDRLDINTKAKSIYLPGYK